LSKESRQHVKTSTPKKPKLGISPISSVKIDKEERSLDSPALPEAQRKSSGLVQSLTDLAATFNLFEKSEPTSEENISPITSAGEASSAGSVKTSSSDEENKKPVKSRSKRIKKSASKVSFSSETTEISDNDRVFRANIAPVRPQTRTLFQYEGDDFAPTAKEHFYPSAGAAASLERERKLQDRIEFLRSSIKKGIDGMNRVLDNMQQARYRDQVLSGEITTGEYFDNIGNLHLD